ncbi:O-antigen ligase family protein [Hydrogenimonas sp. SS33]|uniref:O-antigen ligase family protein n=1 Tax=Hydrogenimonas leucolamina TaxID=2954236 RepID=UPI00336BE548
MIRYYIHYGVIAYWVLLLLINAARLRAYIPVSANLSYVFLGISLLFSVAILLKNPKILADRAFMVLWLVLLYSLFYYILFDQSYNGMLYLAAKTATFLMIAVNLYYGYDYLIENFMDIVIRIGFAVLVVGVLINTSYFGGRYTGPFGNPNSLGWLSSLLFGLTYLGKKQSPKTYAMLLFLLAMVMMSGSRASMGGVVLAILLKGRLTPKKIFILAFGIAMLFALQNVASHFGVTTGLDRIIKSEKNNRLLSGRASEYALGILTVKEAPITGHGLDKYAYISERILRISGILRKDPNFVGNPHNSFIAMFVMYGIPIGLLVFLTLVLYILKVAFSGIDRKDLLFAVLFSFIAATFESYLFGVSGFEGLIFWMALPMSLMYIEKKQACKTIKSEEKEIALPNHQNY